VLAAAGGLVAGYVLARLASMAVAAVVLTTAAIAFLGWRFAGLPIAAAIALGAIVAPPDAVAANEVLRHLRIPQRIGLVLQGESMLNVRHGIVATSPA
jgi:NhaP-type Na+/H+ or K+/H+ antiporter